MGEYLFRNAEQMEMDEKMANQQTQNARATQYAVLHRKVHLLLILTVVNVLVSSAVVTFVFFSSSNAEQLAKLQNDQKAQIEKSGKWEKQQQEKEGQQMKEQKEKEQTEKQQQKADQTFIAVLKDRFGNASADQLAVIQKKFLERMDELEKKNEQMANTNAEQLAKVQNEISEIGKWVKKQQKEKEQREKEKKEVEQMEKEQKEKEQRENALLKLRMNFWDPNACHGDIEIVGNERLTVRKKGKDWGWRTVIAKHSISLNKASDGIFYFEISIKQNINFLSFGFAFKQMDKLDASIHGSSGTYAWDSDGRFWIDGSMEGPYDKYSFGVGDVVGIGVKLVNRQMIFTKNGLRLDASDVLVDPSSAFDDLFPFVTLVSFGDEIEANFGPNFAFDLATL